MSQSELLARLGVAIQPELLELALTHPSFSEGDKTKPNYQRLEFLGDSVLGLVVSEVLFRRFPEFSEKKLTQLKTAIIKEAALAELAKNMDVGPHIKLSHGMRTFDKGAERPSILSDVFEAIIGAVYLSNGYETTYEFLETEIAEFLDNYQELLKQDDPRAKLHEWAISNGHEHPEYSVEAFGKAHKRSHTVTLQVADQTFTATAAKSSEAKVAAARVALAELSQKK